MVRTPAAAGAAQTAVVVDAAAAAAAAVEAIAALVMELMVGLAVAAAAAGAGAAGARPAASVRLLGRHRGRRVTVAAAGRLMELSVVIMIAHKVAASDAAHY